MPLFKEQELANKKEQELANKVSVMLLSFALENGLGEFKHEDIDKPAVIIGELSAAFAIALSKGIAIGLSNRTCLRNALEKQEDFVAGMGLKERRVR